MSQRVPFVVFSPNPIKAQMQRILAGDRAARVRRLTDPKSGWTALRLKVFPTSASQANNPQVVKKNGGR